MNQKNLSPELLSHKLPIYGHDFVRGGTRGMSCFVAALSDK